MNNNKIKVGITHGDTNGIGYEVILKMLEALSGVENVQVYELDEEENESKATRKKKELQNHFSDSL